MERLEGDGDEEAHGPASEGVALDGDHALVTEDHGF